MERSAPRRTDTLPTPTENANRLAGLQAWMADIDRRLSIRTKLILLLAAISIGGSGAAIYLAIEANRTAADQEQVNELEARVDRLESELEAVAEAGGAAAGGAATEPERSDGAAKPASPGDG